MGLVAAWVAAAVAVVGEKDGKLTMGWSMSADGGGCIDPLYC
jgi:hypothetical protein